jgi:hypothetical protein
MPDPDWDDPCAVLAWLRPFYLKRMAGETVQTVGFDSRTVGYATGDLKTLANTIAQYEAACAKKQGLRPARYAMRLGSRYGGSG